VDAEDPTLAALDLLGVLLLPLDVPVAVWLPDVVVALAAPEDPPPVAEPALDPESLMEVLMQLVSEPEMIVAWPEKA